MIYYCLASTSPFRKCLTSNLYFQTEVAADSSHANVPRTRPAQAFRSTSHLCQKTGACESTNKWLKLIISPALWCSIVIIVFLVLVPDKWL